LNIAKYVVINKSTKITTKRANCTFRATSVSVASKPIPKNVATLLLGGGSEGVGVTTLPPSQWLLSEPRQEAYLKVDLQFNRIIKKC